MRESVGDWRKGEPEKAEDVRNSNWLKSKLNARVVGREGNKQEWMVGLRVEKKIRRCRGW